MQMYCVCVYVLFIKHLYYFMCSNISQFKSHYNIVSSGIITLSFHTAKHNTNWNPKYDMIAIL